MCYVTHRGHAEASGALCVYLRGVNACMGKRFFRDDFFLYTFRFPWCSRAGEGFNMNGECFGR